MTGNLIENTVSPDYMITSEDSVVVVKLLGDWAYDPQFPEEIDGQLQQTLQQGGIKSVQVNMEQVIAWDSALLTVIISLTELCEQLQINFDSTLLPSEMTRMLRLVDNIPIREVKKHTEKNKNYTNDVSGNFESCFSRIFIQPSQIYTGDN